MEMIDLGMKRKEAYGGRCSPCCDEDSEYDNEIVYPELYVEGKQATMMGADDFDVGDEFEVPCVLKVRRISKSESAEEGEEKQSTVSMTLCLVAIGEEFTPTSSESDDDDDYETGSVLRAVL